MENAAMKDELKFQSTLPYRERPATHHIHTQTLVLFQSTLPYRERHLHFSSQLANDDFNPRSLTGSDYLLCSIQPIHQRFQSTLPYRERLFGARVKCKCPDNFNPRSLTGSDSLPLHTIRMLSTFQSTLPYRERHSILFNVGCVKIFQSTLPYRERHSNIKCTG